MSVLPGLYPRHWLGVLIALAAVHACQPPATPAPTATAPVTATPPPTVRPVSDVTPIAPSPTLAPPSPSPAPSATAYTATPAPLISPTPFAAPGALLRSEDPAWSVAWSPDGQRLAAGAGAGKLTMWDPTTGRRVWNLWVHAAFIHGLAFSPDSTLLASGAADGSLIIWKTADGGRVQRLEGHSDGIEAVAWSPDGQWLGVARSPDPGLLLWDTATWEVAHDFAYSARLFDLAWAPDSTALATGTTRDLVVVWDPLTAQPRRELAGHQDNVLNVAWSPDGRWLASRALDNELIVWEAATGAILRRNTVGRGIFHLAWSPDSQWLAYSSLNGPVVVWAPGTGEFLWAVEAAAVRGLAWSPDGAQLAAATENGVRLWPASRDLVPSPTPRPAATATGQPPTPTVAARVAPGDQRPMVLIPAGPFVMGAPETDPDADPDERPQHTVTLAAYWLDVYEVSHTDYAACVTAGACQPPAERDSNGFAYAYAAQMPTGAVVNVTWNAAAGYCAWAGKRLPTEAEWEKAAHGDAWRLYPWGSTVGPSGQAWFCEQCIFNRDRPDVLDDFSRPAPVTAFPEGVSPYGVHNLAGNVWEWVADWYSDATYSAASRTDPRGPENGTLRVIRGGAWTSPPEHLRTTYRNAWRPDTAWIDVGFRCAADPD